MRITRYAAVAAAAGLAPGRLLQRGRQPGRRRRRKSTAAVATDVSFAAGTTMARLHEAGKITIGTKFDQPGFGLLEPADRRSRRASTSRSPRSSPAKLGIEADDINWTETVSANREPFIQNGKVDIVVATYTINDTRKQVVDFAGPYYVAGQDIMVAKDNPENITGPDDLAGKKVCSVEGSTPAQNIQDELPAGAADAPTTSTPSAPTP